MRIRSAISTDMNGIQWRKLDVELESSDEAQVYLEAQVDPKASIAVKFDAMRKKADSLLTYWMMREGLITAEEAAKQLAEIKGK